MFKLKNLNKRQLNIFAVSFLFLLVLILNIFSANDYFLSDDFDFLGFASQVNSWSDFKQFIIEPIGGNIYRPILNLTFLIEYKIWGLNPIPYHLSNIFLHFINGILIFYLISYISKRRLIGFVTALLYLAYPAHHESVTWIAGRTDVLCTTFYLIAIYSFIKYIKDRRGLFYIISIIATLFALFTKELAVSLPLLLVCIAIAYKYFETKWKRKVWVFLPYFLLLGIYIFIRRLIVGGIVGGYQSFSRSTILPESWGDIVGFLLYPINFIKHIYNYSVISDLYPYLSKYLLLVFIVFLILLLFAYRNSLSSFKKISKVILYTLGFIYVTTLPMMKLMIHTKADLQNTRFFYLPSIAVCFIIAYLLFNKSVYQKNNKYLCSANYAALLSVFILLGYINYIPWKDASDATIKILKESQAKVQEAKVDSVIYLLNLPIRTRGAYVYQNGIDNAVKLFNNRNDIEVPELIIKPDRSQIKSSCLNKKIIDNVVIFSWDKDKLIYREDYLLQWEKSNNKKQVVWNADEISENWNVSKDLKMMTSEVNQKKVYEYKVEGRDPYLVSPEINIDSMEFGIVELEIEIPENQAGHDAIGNIYWSNEDKSFNEDNKVYYILNKENQKSIIYLCGYPNWVFQDKVKKIRIDLSDEIDKYKIKKIKIY